MIEKRECPVCSSAKKRILYNQKFSSLSGNLLLKGYDVVSCSGCGFAYADVIPGQKWFDSYYRKASKYLYDQRDGKVSQVDRTRFGGITRMISEQIPDKQGRILDFGCATGGLLKHLKDAGYRNLLGFEKTASSAALAQRLYSIPVVHGSFNAVARREKAFDLLILSGVLEHVRDVNSLFGNIHVVLRNNGLIFIEVPDAIGFKDHAEAPFQEFSVEHINFFSSLSMRNLLARFGFEPVAISRLTRDYTAITTMPVLCGFFRLTGKRTLDVSYSRETRTALESYIAKSMTEERRISSRIAELVAAQTPVIVWGVGTYTLHLLESTEFGNMNIVAFTDSNKNYQHKTLRGKPILAPAEIVGRPEAILLSSYAFQSEIKYQIRRILKLPNDIITLKSPTPKNGRRGKQRNK